MTKKLWDYKHPYYCSDSNYYSGGRQEFDSWADFVAEWEEGEPDDDLNLLFRWDFSEELDRLDLFYMLQRKGNFFPVSVKINKEKDYPKVKKFLDRKWAKMQEIWAPLSKEVSSD